MAVAGALKLAGLYEWVRACVRATDESLDAYTARFALEFAHATRPMLLVNMHSCLHDGEHGTCECLALPAIGAAVVLRLTGPPVVVGVPEGASTVAAALARAGIRHVVVDRRQA